MTTLNLGAGNRIEPNAINHDAVKHRAEINVAHDLNALPWPWADESFDLVIARSVFEHLQINLIQSVNECWRILRPGGKLYLKLPYWNSASAYRDPTHYWRFDMMTPTFFDPDTEYGKAYRFYTDRKWRIIKGPRLNNAKSSLIATLEVRK